MTIKEASKKYGVTTQAIYQRIKKSGAKLSTIKDNETGNLTAEGEKLLCELFTKHSIESVNMESGALQVEQGARGLLEQVERERDALRADVSRLEAELRGERELRAAVERERDTLRTALDQSQQLQAMTLSRIPEPRKTLWQRLLERKRDGETAER